MSIVSELDVENVIASRFASLGWTVVTGHDVAAERENQREVFLLPRLRAALARLNPAAPSDVRDDALRALTRDRGAVELVNANREVHGLLRDGIKCEHRDAQGALHTFTVRFIDWDAPANDDLLLVRQLTVTATAGACVPDLVGFINGIPLVVGELKGVGVDLATALTKNLDPYRAEIPQLFVPNAVVLLSNHTDTRVGTLTGSSLEHFARYTRLREDDARSADVDTALRAVFAPAAFLDLVESFVLYEQSDKGLRKLLGQNHQRLGVNAAVARIAAYGAALDAGADAQTLDDARRLGVFWHTQGSGKSYSMAFLVRKVQHKVPGDWSFVVVTDRDELDEQIYKNFVATGVTEKKKGLQAATTKHLRKLLEGNERVVFTLIHKFRLDEGQKKHPTLAVNPRVLVLADEAHRSQYATFATSMRQALPNAGFMAFTGTPLLASDTTTRAKFGDYVSRYPFFQAIEDGATVPLYYEATIPDVQLGDRDLDAAMDRVAAESNLSDEDRQEIERYFSRFYVLLTRSSRLDKVAAHMVDHLLGFAPPMKAMAVCVDRPTTLRLAQRVEKVLALRRQELRAKLEELHDYDAATQRVMTQRLAELDALEWAVVVSRSQGDVESLSKQLRYHAKGVVAYAERMEAAQRQLLTGVGDAPYRGDPEVEGSIEAERAEAATDEVSAETRAWVERTLSGDVAAMAERFKRADDPLRLVLVCSMWITGFDAPPCGVVYLDRPMANHTLMQTIARANRVFPGKDFGLVMDYVGVLRNLEKAFKDYEKEHAAGGALDRPVADKAVEIARLAQAVGEARTVCQSLGVSLDELYATDRARRLAAVKEAVELFATAPAPRRVFRALAAFIDRQCRALGDDPRCADYTLDRAALCRLSAALAELDAPRDLTRVLTKLDEVLDEVLEADADRPALSVDRLDLGAVDLVALDAARAALAKNPEGDAPRPGAAQVLAIGAMVQRWTAQMAQQNPTLVGLQRSVQEAIDEYAAGARDLGSFVVAITTPMETLKAQIAREAAEGLTRVELANYDVLLATLGDATATTETREGLKTALRALRGLRERVGRDWRNTDQGRSRLTIEVRDAIHEAMAETLKDGALKALREALFARLYETL